MNIAIVLASGQGQRMDSKKNKVFLALGGKPLLFYCLRAFEDAPEIQKILITARPEERATIQELARQFQFQKIMDCIPGGRERQDSAFNALQYLHNKLRGQDNPVILFHNGANPFVTTGEITRSIRAARAYGAAVIAHPTRDTIKEINEAGLVVKTLERRKLWNMQTPQVIRFRLAFRAFERAARDGFVGTDDVSLVERLGQPVKVLAGSPYNYKITYPLDLELAEIILKKMGKATRRRKKKKNTSARKKNPLLRRLDDDPMPSSMSAGH